MYLTKYMYHYRLNNQYVLMINTLHLTLDILERVKFEAVMELKQGSDLQLEPALQKQLMDRGYLYHSPEEETEKINMLLEIEKKNQNKRYTICPSFDCNLHCTYCFERLGSIPGITMSDDVLSKALDLINDSFAVVKNRDMALFGGEPYLSGNRELVEKIFQFARAKGSTVFSITNGVDLDQYQDLFIEFKDYQRGFQITVDGIGRVNDQRRHGKDGHGSFAKIRENVCWLLENGFNVDLRINVDQENVDTLEETLIYIEEHWSDYPGLKIDVGVVTDIQQNGYGKELDRLSVLRRVFQLGQKREKLFKILNYGPLSRFRDVITYIEAFLFDIPNEEVSRNLMFCQAASLRGGLLGADGYIYVCNETVGNTKYAIGRFYPQLEYFDQSFWSFESVVDIPGCKNCSLSLVCLGGCPLERKMSQKLGYCDHSKEVLDFYFDCIKDKLVAKLDNVMGQAS